jgi:hypothetical protein
MASPLHSVSSYDAVAGQQKHGRILLGHQLWRCHRVGQLQPAGRRFGQSLDMGRPMTNIIGNSMAAAVVAKWEGEHLPAKSGSADLKAQAPK